VALITTSEAKQQIPGLTGTAEDTLLTELITITGRVFAQYCGYPAATAGAQATMESQSYTLYLDGPGGRELVVPVWPVTAVASIYDSADRRYGADELVASTDYTLIEGQRGLVELDWDAQHGTWSTRRRAIKITCTAGWVTVPDAVKHAARLMVRHLYDLRQTQGKTSQSIAGGSVALPPPTSMPVEVRELLGPYRLPRALVPV
jgi:hypothetical protein